MPQSGQSFQVTTPASKAIRVLNVNPDRIEFSLKDLGSTDIYYGFDQDVSSSGAKGGWLVGNSQGSRSNDKWKGEVWIYCTAAVIVCVEEISVWQEP